MKWLAMTLRVAVLVSFGALSTACVSLEYGTPLVTGGLESLELGQSSHSDILLALGKPRGTGSVRVSQHPEPRDILFFEFLKSDGRNVEIEILVVFMLDQRYDGYLWFASTERIQVDRSIFEGANGGVQGYFPETEALENTFSRGQTSQKDVVAVLGAPTGIGAAIIPPEHHVQQVLFFEDIEVEDMQSEGGEIVADMRQRILLVMLTDEVYDGFMWYSNTGAVEGRAP